MAAVWATATFHQSANAKDWFELFKSGFLILGGGLTTVIGYYFGSRGTDEATASAAAARKATERERQELEAEKLALERAKEELSPTIDEQGLTFPEEMTLPEQQS